MNLYKETLPKQTLTVFDALLDNPFMATINATLLGGTALSLQINHRLSEDLDFACFSNELPIHAINTLIYDLKIKGLTVINTLDTSKISQARINGYHLEDYIQEYTFNGVKVSFFVLNKNNDLRLNYFKNAPTLNISGSFKIFSIDSLFDSKAVVLLDRVKSRDIYDLMVLIMHHGYQVADIIESIKKIDQKENQQARVALNVLTGLIPLDKDDPGFNSIGVSVKLDEIYAFFNQKVNEYESGIARTILTELGHQSTNHFDSEIDDSISPN